MEASQYSDLAQQLAAGTQSARGEISADELKDKLKTTKDFFLDSGETLLGKALEEKLDLLKKGGGVLKSLGIEKGDIENITKQAGSKATAIGRKFAADAKAKVQQTLENAKAKVKSVRNQIRGEADAPASTDVEGQDVPLQNVASGDVASATEANPVAQDGQMVTNAEHEAQTTEESIRRGGGSVLGEDQPVAGSAAASSQEQAALKQQTTPEPDENTTSQQQGASAQNDRNEDKEDDEDGDGEGKFERDLKKATKDTEEEDAVDPEADEATLPLTAILGGISLIASMFTKDHHKAVVQQAVAGTSYAVQTGI